MSSFTNALITQDLNNGKFRVVESFSYYVGDETSNFVITVPKDFEFDCFSVPRGFRWLIPKVQERGNQAAALHDWLYNQRFVHGLSRKQCDDIFLEAMEVLGVARWRRELIYRAVRIGGGFKWNKKEA